MARDSLGGFEMEIMQIVMRQAGKAYGVSIAESIEAARGRLPSTGSIYTTLERLERKGFVRSAWGEPSAARGGRRKRYYELTGNGARAMQPAGTRPYGSEVLA